MPPSPPQALSFLQKHIRHIRNTVPKKNQEKPALQGFPFQSTALDNSFWLITVLCKAPGIKHSLLIVINSFILQVSVPCETYEMHLGASAQEAVPRRWGEERGDRGAREEERKRGKGEGRWWRVEKEREGGTK